MLANEIRKALKDCRVVGGNEHLLNDGIENSSGSKPIRSNGEVMFDAVEMCKSEAWRIRTDAIGVGGIYTVLVRA